MAPTAKASRIFSVFVLGLTVSVLAGSGAMAAEIEMSVTWTGTVNQIMFTVLDPGGHPDWVGYDLQRKTTIECGSETILNPVPLPRQSGQPTTHIVQDPGTVDNTLYEYTLYFVNADRVPISHCAIFDCDANPFVGTGRHRCSNRGPAPIATGYLSELSVPMTVDFCPGSCGLWAFVASDFALLEPYAGTGQAVQLIGNVTCDQCGPEGCVAADITQVIMISCQVGNGIASWGTVKARYR